jgi:heme exporter protein A
LQAINFSGVSAREIHVWRGDRHVLRGVSMTASPGQFTHVAGPNGAGKTTLLRVIAGLLRAEQGEVHWQGEPITANFAAYTASCCYLGHSDALKADFSARENLAYEVGLRRLVAKTEIDDVLSRVGLGACRDLQSRSLSAGQRRRLAMARVMLTSAPLWILDEPFTNLDHVGVLLLSGVIAEHLDAGGAAIVAAHQPPAIPQHPARCVELA